MREVKPEVYLISRPQIDWVAVVEYLRLVGGEEWGERTFSSWFGDPDGPSDAEAIVEFAGRNCYRSWAPGLNPNVTKVRTDSAEYLANILASKHGSVLEHAYYVFEFQNVSRVFTHELCRHRVGTSISQESMRYVRLDDIPFWTPDWAEHDEELLRRNAEVLRMLEDHQKWMADHFGLDSPDVDFSEKKHKTSFMRRFAPDGVATSIVWGANLRTLRHTIEMRTSQAAEEEIRLVFDRVAEMMMEECPLIFGDFERQDDGSWTTPYSKV